MKSLFDKNFIYTQEAIEFSNELEEHLQIIMEEMVSQGFSPREVSYIMQSAATMVVLESILNRMEVQ